MQVESIRCFSFTGSLRWLLLIILTTWKAEAKNPVMVTFPVQFCNGSLCSFQHLEYDSGNNKIYVGAINRIYQLDADLNSEKTAITGPQDDSETCYPHSPCGSNKVSYNNLNKLLKIDYDNRRIVACGSIRQGLCDLRQLGNVTKLLNDFSKQSNDPRANDFVASTSPDQNTVAFIANEGNGEGKKSLYVGSSRTASDSKLISDDDQFPTFASRRMPPNSMDTTMFSSDLNKKEASDSGLLTKEEYAKDGFRVNFISAFEGNQNGYFVLHYPRVRNDQIDKEEIYSYVAQVCLRVQDAKSTTNSYLEIPISSLSWLNDKQTTLYKVVSSTTAKVGSLLQNSLGINNQIEGENPDVLFASFATENGGGSTLAIFPLYELDKIYYDIVRACLSGNAMNHVDWQREKALPCPKIDFPVRKPLCANDDVWDVVGLFQSNVTKQGYTVFESIDTVVTSVAVTKHGVHTVAFMGTKDGKVLKLKVDSKPAGNRLTKPYEEVQVDSHSEDIKWQNLGSPRILADMRLNNDLTRLYVMSERKLVSLPLHDCSRFDSCFECLNASDPFCGWCTLDNRCTSVSECAKGQYTYATTDPGNCPKLMKVDPSALHADLEEVMLKITPANIPWSGAQGRYTCVFGGGRSESSVQLDDRYITCSSPKLSEIPKLNGKEVSVPLSLYFTKDGGQPTVIASTEIVFYDCTNFKSCLPCLSSSEFKCHWCTNDNQCTKKDSPCRTYPGDVRDSGRCPRLISVVDPPHIHQDQSRRVRLRVENIRDIKGKFNCQFSVDGNVKKTVNASRSGQDILCGPMKGFLPPNKHEAKARVDLFWSKKNYVIDNPDSLNVTMYQCSRGTGDNCGKCLQLSQDLKCGWCENDMKCTLCDGCLRGTCRNDTSGIFPGWLDQAQVCKYPEITDFYPKSATPHGVTKITIMGKNLGTDYRYNEIKVVGQVCHVLSQGYKKSERITCEVRNVPMPIDDGKVTLCIQDYNNDCKGRDYEATSAQNFKFAKPVLGSFRPYHGLYAGGTEITFTGKHFDIGNNVTVFIDGRNCLVNKSSMSGTEFSCKLACESEGTRSRRHIPSNQHHKTHRHHHHHHRPHHQTFSRKKRAATEARVKLVFDQRAEYYSDTFYLERNVPDNIPMNPKESITSGGMRLKVTGEHLNLVQSLMLQISFEGHSESRECEPAIDNSRDRICYSPKITGFPIGNYSAKLVFDNCLSRDVGHIRYTKNPYFEQFNDDDHIKRHQSGPIIIMGRNLCPNPLKCDISSVKVDIGDELSCNVTSIDNEKLVCLPPEDEGGRHIVTVHIGGYSQSVGELQFQSGMSAAVYVIIPLCILVILGVIGAACFVYKRAGMKRKMVKDQKKKYDLMEAKVAKECKEAFAELQTEMQSDIGNICTVGIPFRKRHEYIMKVLFPEPEMYDKLNQVMHPYTNLNRGYNNFNGRGAQHRPLCGALDEFDKLLDNKNFVLTFIYTLEQDRRFSMKDRSNVAGLLMIVLQNRLQYATSILEHLLSELIRDIFESNSNPKLLLRRSESVAEKMLTHWFSILLHGFLLECAGEPLFTLYRAIKAQLDKGPVDAITGFAKYSLNQDKLLRQTASYDQIMLIVVEHDTEQQPGQKTTVKVLDCDTITQTKEKIIAAKYKNQPQSQHPSPDDFDLEMTTEPLGRAILNDEDKTSIVDGGWKKLNTLHHYEVKNKTIVTMVPKRKNPPLNHSFNSNHSFGSKIIGMRYNGSGSRLVNDGAGSLPRHMTGIPGSRSTTPTLIDDGKKPFHLTKQHDIEPKDGTDNSLMVSEIYLTRLLATKGTIQKFVDDLFETIFSVVQRGHALPLAIKHMFDFFDEQAQFHGVTDPDVVHTWKSNGLPLRFWVNLIKNPEFIFDIKKSPLIDSCLSVIAGTFMDSCSTADQNLGKDSPSGKLLYAKDVTNYKKWVVNYYDEISGMPSLEPDDMQCFLKDESMAYNRNDMASQAALTELYLYVQKFNSDIVEALKNDPYARKDRLAQRLEQVSTTMTSTV